MIARLSAVALCVFPTQGGVTCNALTSFAGTQPEVRALVLICSPSACRSSAAQPVHTVISQTPSPGSLLRSYRSADTLEGKYSLWQSRGCLRNTRNFCMRNERQLHVKQSALPHPHHLSTSVSPALEAVFEHCKVPLLHPSPPMLPRCPCLKRGLSAPAEG